ncbi:hypothetical protein CRM22_005120 [Opisthorchis felineus]|uniref:DNA-directed DNA polymerase n=1 Tax=Opisthorchis felineus TaxID=147828 RepID=A0A4S2LYD8_OPIFE|nr:hypothetical protein CRM22_005120 [Opisthorchis felineus]
MSKSFRSRRGGAYPSKLYSARGRKGGGHEFQAPDSNDIEIGEEESNDKPLDAENASSASNEARFLRAKVNEISDRRYGFEQFLGPGDRVGWLVNMHPTDMLDDAKRLVSAVDFYFIQEDGSRFKVTRPYAPYFFVFVRGGPAAERDATTYLLRRYSGRIAGIEVVQKEDLDLPNHLVGIKATYLKLLFYSVDELVRVRRELALRVRANQELASSESTYTEMLAEHFAGNADPQTSNSALSSKDTRTRGDPLDTIMDIRESDVPYLMRVCIDLSVFAGCWYVTRCRPGLPVELLKHEDTVAWPEPVVLAFDIETTKLPLKFPDADIDQIMMISYMLDGAGFLLCNREILSEDVENFEFTPRPEFPGHFTVHNLASELDCIRFFFEHIQRVRPNVFVTYNGDMFDWPFIESRAAHYGLSMSEEIAFSRHKSTAGPGRSGSAGEYLSRPAVHIDCLCWVKRDSYLPVGARGLKAVAKAKLHYDPVEVDPEVMCQMAREAPRELANYSVSDAVATYYLYMKYVHPFVFALCTILPLNPDDVLRKGSGTLCEALLMVQAYAANVVFPHKQTANTDSGPGSLLPVGSEGLGRFTEDGRLIDSETYVGGHVEALEAGVFRSDIPVRFRLVPAALEMLRSDVTRCLKRALQTEVGAEDDDTLHSLVPKEVFNKVCRRVEESLSQLAATPNRIECPVIYHLDVGAMYPNIILTNRLQPSAVDSNSTARCSNCQFYKPEVSCQRFMPWTWRAELWTASRPEVYRVQAQLSQERFPVKVTDAVTGQPRTILKAFHELSKEEQVVVEKKRLTDFCRRAYKRIHTTRTEERVAMICQRENSFYVDTVRAFRDRRYKFKGLTKVWKRRSDEAAAALAAGTSDSSALKEANAMLVLYDSLQLAHKCILNSFYGYVMRRGARWYSMEMAGIVCHTGAQIITKSRELIEQVGRGLELDTDGIWCILPASFPQNLEFQTTGTKPSRISISYPGAVLNIMVQDLFTNDQYHELIDSNTMTYKVRSENSIFFEVDGPYKAMVLPAAKEEGKRLKKRYAVFNFDGSLAELKGFEIKRNGELQLIKIFQSSVFEAFLHGTTLTEVYASVARVADHWLDVLYSKGSDMPDSELFDLISENRSMSRRLEDYGSQKSTSLSTARRMAEFLGDQIVKDAGLSCRFVISRQPEGAPVTERAIPLAIFQAEPSVKRHYLRKWLKDTSLDEDTDLRDILDWSYYLERLGSCIQKIITIPAALQQIPNPVPRVSHPDWLLRRLSEKTDTCKQRKLTEMMFPATAKKAEQQLLNFGDKDAGDIEEFSLGSDVCRTEAVHPVIVRHRPSGRLGTSVKRGRSPSVGPPKPWREQLGDPPLLKEATTPAKLAAWLSFHQEKWRIQAERRQFARKHQAQVMENSALEDEQAALFLGAAKRQRGMERYLTQTRLALYTSVWQIIELTPDPGQLGRYTAWISVDSADQYAPPTLHNVSILVPRRFYVNLRTPKPQDSGPLYRKVAGLSISQNGGPAANGCGSVSGRLLPRSHSVYHLYEYNVPEDVYAIHASEIAADLARPDIEGVYELNIPPLFRALMRLGCLCSVDKEALKHNNFPGTSIEEAVFHLDQLRFISLAQHPYLSNRPFRRVFLFHHQQPSLVATIGRRNLTRQLYLLVVPWTASGYVCLIDNARVNQLPDLNKLYQRQRRKLVAEASDGDFPPSSLTFETHVDSDAASARRVVQRWLNNVRQVKRTQTTGSVEISSTGATGAPILVLLHATSQRQFERTASDASEIGWSLGEVITNRRRSPQLPALAGFPVVPLGGTLDEMDVQGGDEANTGSDAYSLLNWQQTAIKRGIRYFIQSEARLERQLELARYLHVPVGNLPTSDAPAPIELHTYPETALSQLPSSSVSAIELGCDLFYARHLAKQNHILWCSPTGCPDLGGKESDDQRLLLEMEEAGVIEISRPGSYPHVTVELELSNLAVNTLLVASRIPELEGATLLSFDRLDATDRPLEEQINQGVNLGANITSYDETAACSAAFRVLRTMVTGWVRDVTQYQNPLADEQIIYFYQWLRSPRSLLYDPALRRAVQRLMKKVFLKLVDELNHLNVDVVYANFSRLIVATRRMELPEALARVNHFTELLRTRPATLFAHLDMQYVRSWRQLLWMDAANFAGVKANVESLVDGKDNEWGEYDVSGDVHESQTTTKLPEPELDMHWHIARYLPETRGLRAKFQTLLAGYLLSVYTAVRTEHRRLRNLHNSQLSTTLAGVRQSGTELAQNNEEQGTNVSDADRTSFTVALQSDASISPGVLESMEQLIREQLAPELYTLVQRLHRKAAWIDSTLTRKDSITGNLGVVLKRRAQVVAAYLAEKTIPNVQQFDTTDLDQDVATADVILPLLPPHPGIYTFNFTPLLDFIKAICELLSLEPSIGRHVAGIRRDLLRLIGVGEFSPEAVWVPPHLNQETPVLGDYHTTVGSSGVLRSLLVYLPEVACPTCNFTRDIDVCRDTHLVQLSDGANLAGEPTVHWTWICPHCRTVYPRGLMEEALVQQLEQIALQHCMQDLQCPKCLTGGGIQETILAQGGSVSQCAECSSRLILTVPTGTTLQKRFLVYREIARIIPMFEGFSPLTQTLFGTGLTWLVTAIGASLCALHTKNSEGNNHVMLAASFWSLLDPAISMAKDDLDWGAAAVFPVTVGLILGAAFVGSASYFLPVDWLMPLPAPVAYSGNIEGRYLSQQASSSFPGTCSVSQDGMEVVRKLRKKSSSNDDGGGETANGGTADGYRLDVSHRNHCRLSDLTPRFAMNRRLWLLIIAVTVHNIPEGLAVGIAFGGIGHHSQSTLANARNLAIGIAIQNFPEGLAVSLPLNAAGCGFAKSFFLGQLSGLVEPVAGIFGCIAVQFFRRLQPYALGFAAGAMLFVVFDDVIPEAQHRGNGRWTSIWAIIGFIVMMVLDVVTAVD